VIALSDNKKERPQNKNLISLTERSPEEALAIRRMGAKAANKKRRENVEARTLVRQVLAMPMKKGKCADPEDIHSLEEAKQKNVPVQTRIVMQELQKYFETGDTEARNWLFRYAFPDEQQDGHPLGGYAQEDVPAEGGGVRVHLLRGEKPKEIEEPEATPDGGAGS
jgi:hypothetical protein